MRFCQKFMSVALILLAVIFVAAVAIGDAEARAKGGGRSFSSGSSSSPPASRTAPSNIGNQRGGMAPGLAGGLLAGGLGGLLLGSMFGGGGQGMGILPWLILIGVGYFLYKRFKNQGGNQRDNDFQQRRNSSFPIPPIGGSGSGFGSGQTNNPFPGFGQNQGEAFDAGGVEGGLAQIARNDRNFDRAHFLEVASDVFFQVQAGWMRRDLSGFRHLLGEQLAGQYAGDFEEMRRKGVINKLESIAIRKVDIVDAGSDGREDFITVLFTANLLDYTVNEATGAVVEGSISQPVKFAERWTWARPTGTDGWRLEGIEVAQED
ncbi:MAG: Tim44 domain-containing protein [Desulfobulbaceae bacterium]|jgi:predicted lipid-binding transport protein (Tim44 family)|nr:Tim44 domain-containing protein [Desulfobulbaceae bacterium]